MNGPVAIVGAGPAGLMAAEVLAHRGHAVHVYDAMPSAGRKFLLAGKGGLNLTHSEGEAAFVARYGARASHIAPLLRAFGAQALRDWAQALGIATFVGTSGRVFPQEMKAAPLLRAWLHRLRGQGVQFHMRHRWTGWSDDGALVFANGVQVHAQATVLALGGASWPQLGSDGAWWPWLAARGVALAPLAPSNCGFDVGWSEVFRSKFEGMPVKSVAVAVDGWRQAGEFVVTAGGIEGSVVYAASAALRVAIARDGHAVLHLDLLPARNADWVQREVAHPRGSRSLGSHLKTRLHIDGVKAGLLWEFCSRDEMNDPAVLAQRIKALPLKVVAARPIAEAISTAGGVRFDALDARFMLHAVPGTFAAGEMLDWEAPTGGYLLTACFATGFAAGHGVADWLASQP